MSKKINITSFRKKGRYFYIRIDRKYKELLNELGIEEENKLQDGMKVHAEVCLEYSIEKGREYSEKEWGELIYKNNYLLIWESAIRLLGIRMHSEKDLSDKLKKRNFEKNVIIDVIEECKRLSFINDDEFGKVYTQEMQNKGDSRNKIKSNLMRKGLSLDLINIILEENITRESEKRCAQISFNKKVRLLQRELDLVKRKNKMLRFLSSRGFSYEIIQSIFEENEEFLKKE